MKKILKVIKNLIIGIIAVIYFTFVIAMTVIMLNFNDYRISELGDTSIIPIDSTLSSEKYAKGDLVLVEAKKIDNIKIGDEIFVYRMVNSKTVTIEIGTVGQIYSKDNQVSFENGETYDMDYVLGSSTKTYEKLGKYYSIIQSRWGFLFVVLVPSFLIFIYELYALVVEIKYGKEDAANIE